MGFGARLKGHHHAFVGEPEPALSAGARELDGLRGVARQLKAGANEADGCCVQGERAHPLDLLCHHELKDERSYPRANELEFPR